MAATLVTEAQIPGVSGVNLYVGTITGDTSYTTGGYAITAPGTRAFRRMIVFPSGGYVPSWDSVNQKVIVYRQKDPAAAGGADIALPEVSAAVNLSAVSFDFIAIGA